MPSWILNSKAPITCMARPSNTSALQIANASGCQRLAKYEGLVLPAENVPS
jgi:hypothetical protein